MKRYAPEIQDALRLANYRIHRGPGGFSEPKQPDPVLAPDDSLKEQFLRRELEGSAPQEDAAAGLLTGKQAALFGAGMLPGSGVASAAGAFPTAEGEFEPSLRENWNEGNYGTAALQALGAAGDLAYGVPVVGGALKLPLAAKLAMAATPKAAGAAAKMAKEIKRSTELTDIARLPREEAIKIARKEPHLIKSGDQSEGFYVGAPRDIRSKRGLTNRRKAFDEYVGADPRGSDWYDRYRAGVDEVTGKDPEAVNWMTKLHGMMSAGVDPGSETQFALRENNAHIAGEPVKAARPAQHEALKLAIQALDPGHIMLGDKTGEYARLIHPQQAHVGATGVNDFRHARNWGYTEASGAEQRDALTEAQHRFMDYETALAVDRANKSALGGKTDWTGEQLQAAPWVRQKAIALATKSAKGRPYEEAFRDANKTIVDFFPKHTAYATHEALPGPATGHLSGLPTAPQEVRDAFSLDPRSRWNNAPGGRDALYSGLGVPGTGVKMRVRPSIDMQGAYKPENMDMQFNEGQTARPLVAFDTEGPAKTVAPADRKILDAIELSRAYIDAQDAGAWHKPFTGGKAGASNSYTIPLNRRATPEEIVRLKQAGAEHGIGDVADTGEGLTVTNFEKTPAQFDTKGRKRVEAALRDAAPEGAGKAERAAVDSGYAGLTDEWKKGLGSGAATRALIDKLDETPAIRDALDRNEFVPSNALARLERDEEYAGKFGVTRADIQNARRIIGEGPGWIERLREGVKKGALLPAIAVAILGPAALRGADPTDSGT